MPAPSAAKLHKPSRQDFVSSQEVRWCPGCGSYAILSQIQKVLAERGLPREKVVFISGIGCSSRFPYYMNTYGMHTIHGRAPTLAQGLRLARPDLSVWIVTGDGDGLAIGGNHFIHLMRRNMDVNIVMFNNRIYGLTKGQCSPTSPLGHKTKSSPYGTIEQGFYPASVAIGAEATFVARTVDNNPKHLSEMFLRATDHRGTSFVEVLENCVIFNDGTWREVTDPKVRGDRMLLLEEGRPLIFGRDRNMGIRIGANLDPEIVTLGDGITEADLIVHDSTRPEPGYAFMLSRLRFPEFPVPIGVLRNVSMPTQEARLVEQLDQSVHERGMGDLETMYRAGDTWMVGSRQTRLTPRPHDAPEVMLDESYLDDLEKGPLPEVNGVTKGVTSRRISEFPQGPAVIVKPSDSLESAVTMMKEVRFGCVVVCDEDGRLVGILTSQDLVRRVACRRIDLSAVKVADHMTPKPTTLRLDMPIARALHYMVLYGFRHIPIVDDDGRPTSVLAASHFIRNLREDIQG